jgi:hypothetical protein
VDSIGEAMTDGEESAARAAVPALRALLPSLANATDSTWAHIRLLEAYAVTGDMRAACRALDAARGKARTASQREVVSRWSGQLSCD